MIKTERESISFKKEYHEEYEFFIKESNGNKSWYICELLRKERLRKESEENNNNDKQRKVRSNKQ